MAREGRSSARPDSIAPWYFLDYIYHLKLHCQIVYRLSDMTIEHKGIHVALRDQLGER